MHCALRTVIGMTLVALSFACGSDDSGNGTNTGANTSGGAGGATSTAEGDFLGACDTREDSGTSQGQCRDWYGDPGPDLRVSCQGFDGDFRPDTPCPDAERVASCKLDPVLGVSAVYNYYRSRYSEADAEETCGNLEGTFRSASDEPGTGGAGGTPGTAGASSGGSQTEPCPPECFRPYECVDACGDEPRDFGCCPCPSGMIDVLQCN
jgi:hypothetical protein